MLVQAIDQRGVFKPTERVDLPEGTIVEFEPRVTAPRAEAPELAKVYAILGERYNSSHVDTAERHNEHQP
jgi:predicted DNA-binding antitoxin AbrB/MazE fold protein